MRLWLFKHYRAVERRQIPLGLIFEAVDLEDAKNRALDIEMNSLSYKKLADWFAFLDLVVRLGCPTPDEVQRLAECKATRDVFVHNRGIANEVYRDKSGPFARFKVGEPIDVSEPYHRDCWDLIKKVVSDLSNAAIARA